MPGMYDQGALLNSGADFMRNLALPEQQEALLGLRQQEASTNQFQTALAAQKQQSEIQRRTAYQGKVAELLQNPSAAAMAALAAQFPEYGSEAKAAFDALDERKRSADLQSMGEVYSAASVGKFDIAANALRRRIEADRAAGDVDEEDQRILTELESGDPQRQRAAMTYIGMGMAAVAPKEFAAAFGAINKSSEPNLRSVSPGDIVYDERTGQKVFESPYRPTTQTITNPDTGQTTVIQFQQGGGDQSSPRGDLFSRVLRAEGGTDAQGNFKTSPKGAVGPAQVMPATAREAARLAGLPYDENKFRSDPNYNMALGKAYLAKQLEEFGGNEALAAAAYNAGAGRVRGALNKGGLSKWLDYVPQETRDYVKKVTGQVSSGASIPPGFVLDK